MEQTIYEALCACLGLSPDSEKARGMIRPAYADPERSPRPARSADVIYYSLSPEEGEPPPAYLAQGAGGGAHIPAVHRFVPYTLLVVCYGPAAGANAERIRSFLFLDGAGLPRQALRKRGIYPVPSPPAVQLLYEPEGSLFRRRADLTVSLRAEETLAYSAPRGAISLPPEVILRRD